MFHETGHRMMEGKTVFITGGAGGIGYATAQAMLREGALAVLITDITEEIAGSAAARLLEEFPGSNVEFAAPRLTDEKAVRQSLFDFAKRYGRLDAVCCIAGITHNTTIKRIHDGEFAHQINVNLIGTYTVNHQAVIAMMKQGFGSIVNCSSVTGTYGSPMGCGYSASKGAVNALTKSIAREVGQYGIRVNAVAPGSVKTRMTEGLSPEAQKAAAEGIALGRMGEPYEIANMFLFLCSEMSSYCTGGIFHADGMTF